MCIRRKKQTEQKLEKPFREEKEQDQRGQMLGIGLLGLAALVALSMGVFASKYEEYQENIEKYTLPNYEVYHTFNEEYKDYADKMFEDYVEANFTREEACKFAINDTIDKQYRDLKMLSEKYFTDENWNGVYDSVERGEITQEEANQLYEKYYGKTITEVGEEIQEKKQLKTLDEIIKESEGQDK